MLLTRWRASTAMLKRIRSRDGPAALFRLN
jgi:hypothetical protein